MGNRGHIIVESAGAVPVILYTHWAGDRIMQTVEQAEKEGARMKGDPEYLAASLFHFLAKDHDGTSGYGISASRDIDPASLDCNVPPVYVNADTGEYRTSAPWRL